MSEKNLNSATDLILTSEFPNFVREKLQGIFSGRSRRHPELCISKNTIRSGIWASLYRLSCVEMRLLYLIFTAPLNSMDKFLFHDSTCCNKHVTYQ